MIASKGFAFLNRNGRFVSITEATGHTGKKVFVSEVESIHQASVFPCSDLKRIFIKPSNTANAELEALTAIGVTVSRIVTVGT